MPGVESHFGISVQLAGLNLTWGHVAAVVPRSLREMFPFHAHGVLLHPEIVRFADAD